MHFQAFITGVDSFRWFEPKTPPRYAHPLFFRFIPWGCPTESLWYSTVCFTSFPIQCNTYPIFTEQVKTDREELQSDVLKTKQKNTHVNGFSDSLKPNGVVDGRVQQKENVKNGLVNGAAKNGFIKNGVGTNGTLRNRSDKTKLKNGLNKSSGSKYEMTAPHRTDENHNPLLGWSQSLKNWVTGRQENGGEEETQPQCQRIKVGSSIRLRF